MQLYLVPYSLFGASLVAQLVNNLPTRQETQLRIPESGRSPGGGNGNPLQSSCPENSLYSIVPEAICLHANTAAKGPRSEVGQGSGKAAEATGMELRTHSHSLLYSTGNSTQCSVLT